MKRPSSSTTTATVSRQEEHHVPWQGPWHFEKDWFEKQHPGLPRFVKNIALKSTLILDEAHYHQVDHEGKPLKEKRPLIIKSLQANKALLSRIEGRKEIEFTVERREDEHLYYCEGKSVYKIHRPPDHSTEEEQEPKASTKIEPIAVKDGVWDYAKRWEPEF